VTAFEFYKIFQPLNLHFSSSYNGFKYGFKTKSITESAFSNRKDKSRFEVLANKCASAKQAGQHCIANFIYNDHDWIYHSYKETYEVYLKWKGIRQSQTRFFNQDIETIINILENSEVKGSLFLKTPSGNKPPLMQLFMKGKISKETLAILAHYHNFLPYWIKEFDDDPLVSDQLFLITKYQPFLVPTLDETFERAAKVLS
jgi:hypothetical protein